MNTGQDSAVILNVSIEGCQSVIALEFSGTVALSTLYEIDIQLLSTELIDATTIFNKTVQLTWQVAGQRRTMTGLIAEWQLSDSHLGLSEYYAYTLKLMPFVSQLRATTRIASYLNLSLPDIFNQLLTAYPVAYRLDLHNTYAKKAFVCQFQENDWHFISRWLERLGMFYYFEYQHNQETLVITDSNNTLKQDVLFNTLLYKSTVETGLESNEQKLWQFSYHKKRCPQTVQVVAYDPMKASQTISVQLTADATGQGTVKIWQQDLLADADVKAYCQTLVNLYQWQSQTYQGSVNHSVVPGTYVLIDNTYQNQWNKKNYLIIKAHYFVSQRHVILANINHEAEKSTIEETLSECQFEAILLSQAYNAPNLTKAPVMTGMMPAFITDSSQSGNDIPINATGCYQVALSAEQQAITCWLRMCQPYANNNSGFTVPLHAGTEVILGFLYGNPDLPIILGVVFNSTHSAIINDANKSQSGIISCNNNRILFNDQAGNNTITLTSGDGTATITLGP